MGKRVAQTPVAQECLPRCRSRRWALSLAPSRLLFVTAGVARRATAGPYLVVDAATGETIVEKDATTPWYPASLTKLMTTYVALTRCARAGSRWIRR